MAISLDELFTIVAEKHLPGQHNQLDHGRRRTGTQDTQGSPIKEEEIDKGDSEQSPFLKTHHIRRERGPDGSVTRTLRNGTEKTKRVVTYKYFDSITGKEIKDKAKIELWKKAGPPAAHQVLINPDPKAELVATWLDSKNRLKRVYSLAHNQGSAAEKYQRLKDFNKMLPKMRKRIREDLKSDSPRTRETAAVALLIDKTAFRLGGMKDTKAEVQAYGAVTLLNKHVRVVGNKLVFDFIGKKGVRIKKTLRDAELAAEIEKRKTANWSDRLWNVRPYMVHSYIKKISNKLFSAKDFRTWHGTNSAWGFIKKRKGPASTESIFNRWQKEVGTKVAKHLGNSASVAISNYIDPHAWDPWRKPEWGPFIPKKLRGDD